MEVDDEGYKQIIDTVADDLVKIFQDDPSENTEGYDHQIDELGNTVDMDSPVDEYYTKEYSEKSRRLASSSDHSSSHINNFKDEEDKDISDHDLTKASPKSSKNSNQKEYIGAHSFTAHELLGTGSFGEVYLVEKISDRSLHAMKVLCKDKIFEHKLARYAKTERNVLSVINHPFIVRLNFSFQTQNELFLILQYCPGGDLSEYLHVEKKFNEYKARIYCCEVLLALEELHAKDIIFRDLKPDNVVLNEEGHALLTDFGLSKEDVSDFKETKSFCGSYAYLAPEMVQKTGHGKTVDWYLLGVFLYEMLVGIPPYYDNDRDVLFYNIINEDLELPSYISKEARDLIVRLMDRNPLTRLGSSGAADIKKHKWF